MSKSEYKVFADREFEGAWRAETLSEDSNEVCLAIFSGPDSERLAHEYAAFRSGKHPAAQVPQTAVPPVVPQDTLLLTLETGDNILIRPRDFLWAFNPRCKKGLTASPKPAIEFISKGKS